MLVRGYKVLCSAILLTPAITPCWAQDAALEQPRSGILSHATAMPRDRVTTMCPSSLGDHRDQLEASIPTDSNRVTCRVEEVHALGDAVGLQWWAVKYLTRYVFPADSMERREVPSNTTDTADVLDVVIYAVERGTELWRPEWQGWAELRMTREVDVSLGVRGGMAMFSIVSCVNGTGGCDQHFLGRTAHDWASLNEKYRTQLDRRFGGHPFWKGIVVDVRTLRGTVPLYSNEDANCCASRVLLLTLLVQGQDIVVKSAAQRAAR